MDLIILNSKQYSFYKRLRILYRPLHNPDNAYDHVVHIHLHRHYKPVYSNQ